MRRGVIAALGAIALASCLEPTEVDVTVTTDVDCSQKPRTYVIAGGSLDSVDGAPTSSSTYCDPNDTPHYLGKLVLIPNESKSAEVDIVVVTTLHGTDPAACGTANADCIIAERQWHFVPHNPIPATIEMDSACLGVVCPPNYTCFEGASCVPVASCPLGQMCTGSVSVPPRAVAAGGDAGTDGGGGPGDASVDSTMMRDATMDSTVPDDTSSVHDTSEDSTGSQGGADTGAPDEDTGGGTTDSGSEMDGGGGDSGTGGDASGPADAGGGLDDGGGSGSDGSMVTDGGDSGTMPSDGGSDGGGSDTGSGGSDTGSGGSDTGSGGSDTGSGGSDTGSDGSDTGSDGGSDTGSGGSDTGSGDSGSGGSDSGNPSSDSGIPSFGDSGGTTTGGDSGSL